MTDKTAGDWSRYWSGRTAAATGEALAGARIEQDPALAQFWRSVFDGAPRAASVLDLACGAGSALRAAHAAGLEDLTGVDVSTGAIEALRAALPGVRGVVAGAQDTGLAGGAFDFIVSQFGFEYAGPVPAAREAIRLAAPGARFAAIAHRAQSPIAAECEVNLARVEAIGETGFIAAARGLFDAVFSADTERFDAGAAQFRPAQDRLMALCRDDPAHRNGLAGHLYAGTQRLYERRASYLPGDIAGWLDDMEAEISAYAGRMASMLAAALDERDVRQVMELFEAAGWTPPEPRSFCLDGEERPVAWQLSAVAP